MTSDMRRLLREAEMSLNDAQRNLREALHLDEVQEKTMRELMEKNTEENELAVSLLTAAILLQDIERGLMDVLK